MEFTIYIIADGEEDLFDIYKYVSQNDSPANAEKLLKGLEETIHSLKELPERGHIPRELEQIGIKTYREIHHKPYRIIYQITEQRTLVHCILDGRRDIMSLLERRLLR